MYTVQCTAPISLFKGVRKKVTQSNLADSLLSAIRGVNFRLQLSPRIRSQSSKWIGTCIKHHPRTDLYKITKSRSHCHVTLAKAGGDTQPNRPISTHRPPPHPPPPTMFMRAYGFEAYTYVQYVCSVAQYMGNSSAGGGEQLSNATDKIYAQYTETVGLFSAEWWVGGIRRKSISITKQKQGRFCQTKI
jgi:hypothetical protein